jgi:hypothetical protein
MRYRGGGGGGNFTKKICRFCDKSHQRLRRRPSSSSARGVSNARTLGKLPSTGSEDDVRSGIENGSVLRGERDDRSTDAKPDANGLSPPPPPPPPPPLPLPLVLTGRRAPVPNNYVRVCQYGRSEQHERDSHLQDRRASSFAERWSWRRQQTMPTANRSMESGVRGQARRASACAAAWRGAPCRAARAGRHRHRCRRRRDVCARHRRHYCR